MGKHFKPTFEQMVTYMENVQRIDMHFSYLLACDTMMFEYTGLPETIDQKFLEQYLNLSGIAAIGKVQGELYAAPFASRNGELDQYGLGKDCTAYVPNGQSIRGVIGKDVAIIYNNSNHTPQTDLFFDTQTFVELDKSTKSNIIFARIAPIFAAGDTATQEGLKAIIEKVIAGELETVVSENLIDMFGLQTGTENLKVLDVFQHPEKAQYIQYLSQFYDVLMRRHFSRRGLSIKTPTKAAQQSTDEIHGMDSVTWFYPLNKLAERQKGVEMVNSIFGTSITVDFSEIWKQEYKAYQLRMLQEDSERETETEETENETERGANDVDMSGNSETNS